MSNARVYDLIFRGQSQLGSLPNDLEDLLEKYLELSIAEKENAKQAAQAAAARKAASDAAKKAAIDQINAELGITNALNGQAGIIETLRTRLRNLRTAREQANDRTAIEAYTRAIEESTIELNRLTGATDRFRGSNGFWQDMKGWVAGALATQQLAEWGTALVKNEAYLEAQRLALRNVITSQADYNNSLEFLDKLSNKYGQDITVLTETYKSFIAASEASGLSLKERNRIYESIVKSGSALKLTNEQIEGSLLAVSQMFSKGNVQAEELRGQLGERLPGAFGLAAKAIGVTESELNDLLKDGKVLAVDLLPKLATELEKLYGDKATGNVNTIAGAYNRATNSLKAWFNGVNENLGITDKWAKTLNFIADNFDQIIQVGKGVLTFFSFYLIALKSTEIYTKGIAIAQTAWMAVEQAALIIKGEWILLTKSQQVATLNLSVAELEAAIAADTLNKALMRNPWGLIIGLIGTAVAAYIAFSGESKRVATEQEEIAKKVAETLAPLQLQKIRFNELANEVLKGKVPLQEQYDILEKLKKQYPDLLNGVTKLSDAEKILNDNKIKTNTQYDYRTQKLQTLKKEFPEQLTGINNLKDAEEKLGKVIRDTNVDFILRSKLLEAEVKFNINREKAVNLIKNQVETEKQLLNVQKALSQQVVDGAEETRVALINEEKVLKSRLKMQQEGVQHLVAVNGDITKIQEDARKKLTYHYEEETKITKTGEGKKSKEKIDSAKTQALIQQKSDNDALEKTRITEQKSLALQRDIAVQRIKDSKASADKKAAEILKIEEKYFSDSAQLTNKWDEKEDKEQEKLAKERKTFKEGVDKALLKAEDDAFKQRNKLHQDYAKESIKLDEKVAKETQKLEEDKFELLGKLRMLDRFAHAKNSEEIIKIEKEEQVKRLEEIASFYRNIKVLEELKLIRIQQTLGEESNEYKAQKVVVLGAEQDFTKAWEKLVEGRTEKTKDEIAKQEKIVKDSLQIINDTANQIFGLFEKQIQKESDATTDVVKKAQKENAKQFIEIEKQLISAAGSLATGDVVGAITKGIGVIFNAIDYAINEKQRIAEAKLAKITAQIQEYIDKTREQVNNILSDFDRIQAVYGTKLELPEIGTASIDKAIEKEIQVGEKIVENYTKATEMENARYEKEKANIETKYADLKSAENNFHETTLANIESAYNKEVEKANDAHQKAIDNINKEFDVAVQKINEKYDLIDAKANQAYSAETLAILTEGSKQLEGLISNEASLNSVREEYATKRNFINQTFALANKEITEGMSQAEIQAINDAKDARDKALYDLQQWYNGELTFIVTSEGQKRKEYTETEKIQNTIQENLDKAALVFQADEIQRALDRKNAIITAEQEKNAALVVEQTKFDAKLVELETAKNTQLEIEAARHAAQLQDIEDKLVYARTASYDFHYKELARMAKEKDDAIAASATKLQELLIAQIAQIQIAMNNAVNSNVEEYTKLAAILQEVLGLYRALTGETPVITYPTRGGNTVPVTDTPNNNPPTNRPRGFKDGTVRLQNISGLRGIDTELINANAGERIIQTHLNDELQRAFGYDITNEKIRDIVLGKAPQFVDYTTLNNMANYTTTSTDPKLLDAIGDLNKNMKGMAELKQLIVTIENGNVKMAERSSQRMRKHA